MEPEETMIDKKAYRLTELMNMFGVSKPSIYRWIKNDGFPRPVKIGQISLWSTNDVDRWWHNRQPAGV